MPASAASRIASAVNAGGHEDHRRVGAGLLDGLGDGVEHRQAVDRLAALAGRDAADHLRAVLEAALGVKLRRPCR